MPSELRSERHGSALVLTLSRSAGPQGLSEQLLAAGVEALNVAESDDQTRSVILRGEGPDFCAPCDFAAQDLAEPRQAPDRLNQLVDAMRVFPKPLIGAVEGRVADAGFALVMACDLVVASGNVQFQLTETARLRGPEGGISWHLAHALPRALAQQLLWMPGSVSAQEMLALGVINRISSVGSALRDALAVAEVLQQVPAHRLASTKELLLLSQRLDWPEHLAAERDAHDGAPQALPPGVETPGRARFPDFHGGQAGRSPALGALGDPE